MNILISGGTGFIGSHLTNVLKKDRHHVYILSRQSKSSEHPYVHYIKYDEDNYNDLSWTKELPEEIDLVYNFSGASLNNKWTDYYKDLILSSRLNMTNMLYQWLFDSKIKPLAFVNASAIGYYPTSKLVEYDEYDVLSPNDFLSTVVNKWEGAARQIESLGIRTVYTRFGLILSREEGALPILEKLYKANLGGNIASSRQWYSWIHIDDVINALYFVGLNQDIDGPVNITAPVAVRQKEFSKVLSAVLGTPNFFKTPNFLLNSLLGERSMLITEGQKVHPRRLLNNEFKYLYPTLDQALEEIYSK
ncbi:TIGR01777 family oxidoreductase [Jeotgalicoccus marinus]|uniref:TIGR01777 family oxidoreductase n=1 Tax=Jeotgalicoccus marinus TaxID=516700 RepID=UPI00042969CD|nr:TIGR01777 family oxidoreductase [Jeotgalicoccus marinus]